VSSAQDIISELGIQNNELGKKKNLKNLKLSKDEKKIYKCLEVEKLTIDEISKLTKIPISKLSIILSGMELSGLLRNIGGKLSLTQTA
jgi:sugar-specific transcriptional regulator TrmB